ncbi:hypothetical protein PVAP13_4KG142805 [Panicum virgatum]|uniref:Uncharacterized protein n=1 Tax=Panicum virgatum TaxID=38727 RepID=A0A8T0TPZ2_PANVG|nr:hypothetical protein PVAP13_4KG142805 [Panicum virgatum]
MDPLFDPSRSSTYRPVPYSSGACRDLAAADYGNGCTYERHRRRPVQVRHPVRGRNRHGRCVQQRQADANARGRRQQLPLRLRRRRAPVGQVRRPARARPLADVPRVAGVVFPVPGRLLLLPPGGEQQVRVPRPRRAEEHDGVRVHAAGHQPTAGPVLRGDHDRHRRRRETACRPPAVGVRGRHDHRHRQGRHGAPVDRVQGAAGGVPGGHGGVPAGSERSPRHLRQLDRTQERRRAQDCADVQWRCHD